MSSSMLRGSSKQSGKYMFDLVVIGGGSGGVRASRIAATHGAKVALIEPSMQHGPPNYSAIGGTCVNVGCVPKKLMVYASRFADEMEHARAFGWAPGEGAGDGSGNAHDWRAFMGKKNAEISRLNGIYGRILGNAGVEIIEGMGSFKSAHEVIVKGSDGEQRVVTCDKVLIAVGGWPHKPSGMEGAEECGITSNEIFYLEERPQRLLVVGGGYIAVEFAGVFAGLGTKVDLLYRGDLFLRGFDQDVREHLAQEMAKQNNLTLHFNSNPKRLSRNEDGTIKVELESGDEMECDVVLLATGRTANTKSLGLDKVGVKTRRDGSIPVDGYSKTNVENIFAVGDVTDRIQLTPVALHEGHCFADTVYGGMDRQPDHEYVPSAVFAHPEVGSCGLTEEQAVERFRNVTVFKSTFKPMVHTLTGLDRKMLMKIIVDDATDKVVGVHIVGEHAAEIIQGVAIAMKVGATKKDFDSTIGLHPSSAEELVTMRSPAYSYKDGAKL